jgi:hypothetical protein
MTHQQPPAPVTRPATGRYLLTPPTWSPEERQELYRLQDRAALLAEMAGAFGCSISDLDMPEEIYIEAVPNSKVFFEYGDKILMIRGDGFVQIAKDPR